MERPLTRRDSLILAASGPADECGTQMQVIHSGTEEDNEECSKSDEGEGNGDSLLRHGKPGIKSFRIPRDFSAAGACQFKVDHPLAEDLSMRGITQEQLKHTVSSINELYFNAESPSIANCVDIVATILTCHVLRCFPGWSNYDRGMAKVSAFIREQNDAVYLPAGCLLVNPRKVADLFLEIEIFAVSSSDKSVGK